MNRSCKPLAARANTILDSLTTTVLCVDTQLRVTYLNTAGQMLFGVSARHCNQKPLHQIVPQLGEHRQRLRQALQQSTGYTERELILRTAKRNSITVDYTVTPVAAPDCNPWLLLEFFSLGRRLRISHDAQLQQQNIANREMLRGLAHEIKNPLGGLRGAAQLLEKEINDTDLKEYTGVIIREADRLRNLIDGLLGPRRAPNKQRLNVHEVLEHVRQLVTPELPVGAQIVRDYDPSIPLLWADREQLVQIVLNLVGNAVQVLLDNGRITLRTRTQRLFTIGRVQHRLVARLDVIDNGPGIAPGFLPAIFQPLVTSRAEGSGMGLPIAQYLVHLHGGVIECENAPGATKFSVYLPLSPALEDGL